MANLIKGVDVSRWQNTSIDWKKVKADGYLFSFLKVTDGSAYSSKFIERRDDRRGIELRAGVRGRGVRPERLHLEVGLLRMVHAGRMRPIEEVIGSLSNTSTQTIKPTTNAPPPNVAKPLPAVRVKLGNIQHATFNLQHRKGKSPRA